MDKSADPSPLRPARHGGPRGASRVVSEGAPASGLHPAPEPFRTRMLEVGDGHRLYVEECGNPDGLPVVVLHGGPGGGCSPAMRRYFDPEAYRAVLFDQRGCGRSRPHASVEANTTWHLVADIERIREALGIEAWGCVFGGSWGATLALLYAQAHPERVRSLVLRGVFLMTQGELDWFYGGGAGAFFPELWARFVQPIPEGERGDMVAAYHRRLFGGDPAEEARHARLWAGWENALASIDGDQGGVLAAAVGAPALGSLGTLGLGGPGLGGAGHGSGGAEAAAPPGDYARAFARIENHFFVNGGFLRPDQAILPNMGRIAGVPGHVVQGRYDMICPPQAAWALTRAWPESRLEMVARAGHALSEPGVTAALVRAMDRLALTGDPRP